MRQRYQQWILRGVRIIMILVIGTSLSACDSREANDYASPEAAAYAMFSAFSYIGSDPESAWAFLGPDTRARLQTLAEQGPDGLNPTDYLRFGWLPDQALVRSVERTDSSGRYATLSIETELGDHFDIELIRVNNGWQVELGPVAMLEDRDAPAAEDAPATTNDPAAKDAPSPDAPSTANPASDEEGQ